MLHDISPDQLRIGMYISDLHQSWIDVSFWRRRFLIANADVLARVVANCGTVVTIDDARGVGLCADHGATAAAPVAESPPAPPPLGIERRRRPRPPGQVDRFKNARRTVDRSKAAVIDMFTQARLGHAVELNAIEPLVDEIAEAVARDRTAIISVTRLKDKNEYTYLHSVAVCALMMNLARQLGLPEPEVRRAGLAGMLHDIGKMAVPVALLDKPGVLDDRERRVVQSHPEHGHALLTRSRDIDADVLDVCLHHHERIDGRGYPHGMTGEELSLFARMGAICDVYDAVTSDRPYKRAWSPGEALARMISWDGHFDPRLLRAFVTSLGIFPIGGLVRLRSNRLAIVVKEDESDPTTPIARAFHDIEAGCAVPIEDVATQGDPIMQAETGQHWFGERWEGMTQRVQDARQGERVAAPTDAEPITAPAARSAGA